jgi:hypothetical protein
MVEYELHIEGMLKAIQERLDEFDSPNNLSEFEQGRQIAYIEMMDIIKTRHKMILEVLNE